MQLNRGNLGVAAVLAVLAASGQARASSDPTGVWIDDTGRGGIEIKDCGGKLCGHLVWIKDPAKAKGCGVQILGDVAPAGPNKWDNGWIYSPEKKSRYDVELTSLSEGRLRVTGYAGTKLFSKTMIWTRAPGDIERCNSEAKATGTSDPAQPPRNEKPVAEGKASAPPAVAAKPETSKPPIVKPRTENTAKAEAKPREIARAQDKDSDESSAGDEGADAAETRDCTIDVPYVSIKFPCKKK